MEALNFSRLLKYAWVIVVTMIIGAAGAFFYARMQPTDYKVQARLLVGPGIDSPRPDLNVLRASGQLIQTYAEMPLTEPFLQEMIEELRLDMQPEELARIISVRPNPETQILTIEVQFSDAATAQAVAYHIADKLVQISPSNPDSLVTQMKGQMESQVVELEQSVAETRASLQQVEASYQKALEEERQGRNNAGNALAITSQLEQFEKNTNRFADAASQQTVGIQILEELVTNTNARITQFEYELGQTTNPITQKLLSEQVRLERTHLSNLRQAIAEINRPLEGAPLDQYIIATQQQIQGLEQGINKIFNYDIRRLQFEEINQLKERLSQARAIETDRQAKILQQIARERERISDVALSRIENQRQILEQITQERSRLAEMQNTLALLYSTIQTADPNQVKIIERAQPIPFEPPVSLMVLIGALAGAALGAVGILGSASFNRSIETSEQVSRHVSVPVIDMTAGQSPMSSLINNFRVKSKRLEMYQMLGVHLLYAHNEEDRRLILVGSADTYADSGIVAANLAVFLAQSGKRVILIDANNNRPTIAGHFNLEQEEGLSDFLAGSTKKYLPITSIDQYSSLGILPFGGSFLDGMYLNTPQMIAQIQRLKERVDIVLVSVPTLLRPDSLALASHASGTILLITKGKTPQRLIEEIVGNFRLVGASLLSVVLKPNLVNQETFDWPRSQGNRSSDASLADMLSRSPKASSETSDGSESVRTPAAS